MSIKFSLGLVLAIQLISLRTHLLNQPPKDLPDLLERSKLGPWETARTSNGVCLSYRDVNLPNGASTRQLLVEIQAKAPKENVVAWIKNPSKLEVWNEGIRSSSLLEASQSKWVLHTVYDIPYPLSQQDLIAEYHLDEFKDSIVIQTIAKPEFREAIEGYTREKFNYGQWKIVINANKELKIAFSVITLSNTSIPAFIKDPIIQRKLIRSFSNLKSLLEG